MFTRLKSEMSVSALIRRAQGAGAFATVVRRGDDIAGAVHVIVRTLDGFARLYAPIRTMEGEAAWLQGQVETERELDAKVLRMGERDPDVWVVEIEDRAGRHFLVDPVEKA